MAVTSFHSPCPELTGQVTIPRNKYILKTLGSYSDFSQYPLSVHVNLILLGSAFKTLLTQTPDVPFPSAPFYSQHLSSFLCTLVFA